MDAMTKAEDKRASKRIGYLCEVECDGAGLSRLATRITDLSTTGAFIDSMTCYAPGTSLRLRFHIKEILVETLAEVRYAMQQVGMGVRFLNLTPDNQAVLESLIEGKPLPAEASAPQAAGTPGTWNTPDMLSGNFAVVSLFDVIQIIENNRLSGLLGVISPAATGEIQFNDGLIVGALCGSQTRLEVLKSFLDVTEGSFEFRRSDVHHQPTILASSNMSLMMELVRHRNEEKAPSL